MRAAQELADQHAGQEGVGGEFGAAGHLVEAVVLDRRRADDLVLAVGVETGLFENGRHRQAPLISLAAASTERMTLS